MKVKRLQRLRKLMLEVDPAKFNMNYWGRQQPCGTTCCALGTAACDLEFNVKGLKAMWRGDAEDNIKGMEVQFEGYTDHEAGREFFGLGEKKSWYLFMPSSYPPFEATTPLDVVRHIDNVLLGLELER